MDILNAIILGIVEGLTEFLPISSTGHLIVVSNMLHVPQDNFIKSFEVVIQSGAILAVLVLYWKSLFLNQKILKRIMIAFIPTAIIGFILYKVFKQILLGNELLVIVALIVGGVIIILFEKIIGEKRSKFADITDASYKSCFLVGLCQSISIIPGVSRAAATILGGMALGFKRETIVKFSFILAIPTMIAATGYDLTQSVSNFSKDEMTFLAVGFIVSFVVAILAIKLFLRIVQKKSLVVFGIYRIAIGVAFLIALRPL